MNRAGAGLQGVLGELSGNHRMVFPFKPGGDPILGPTLLAHCRVSHLAVGPVCIWLSLSRNGDNGSYPIGLLCEINMTRCGWCIWL